MGTLDCFSVFYPRGDPGVRSLGRPKRILHTHRLFHLSSYLQQLDPALHPHAAHVRADLSGGPPRPESKGVLRDCAEVFGGEGDRQESHADCRLSIKFGFDKLYGQRVVGTLVPRVHLVDGQMPKTQI